MRQLGDITKIDGADIEFNGKPAPDTRRYKAIGNGMAQPCADFVIQRIVDEVCPDVND